MESHDNLDTHAASTPWACIATQCATDFKARTGGVFDAWVIGLVAQDPARSREDIDKVMWGFARKAWSRMRHTCQCCGRPGLVRSGTGRQVVVRCSECELAHAFSAQLDAVLNDPDHHAGQERAVWHAHEIPPLIRAAVPSHCWHQTAVPGVGTIRYITASELQALTPWLTRIAGHLRELA